ncbi:DUF423 domain-containing protein [Paenibacillus sp. SYP-B4298]|uniref:DUF423 domain-containing protein n=1 Tax=Paenibacillus sp. SYP-B4298 TaxID=2996034 RepID=UPI0022DD5AE1|nr:DUF423 domain-containing protein [Paenibacillus sp. SYP-B4298]
MQTLLLLGSLNMALVVILGAFGAHALKRKLTPELLKIYETGVLYHLVHGLGLLLIGVLAGGAVSSGLAVTAGWLLQIGIVLFCGSLYVLALTGVKRLGAITPLGGLGFITGWVVLFAAALQG